MDGLVYSYDLHWLVDLSEVKMLYVYDSTGKPDGLHTVLAFMKNGSQQTIFKGTKESCCFTLDNFMHALKQTYTTRLIRF